MWSGDLSIIIVSWNVRDYLAACLDSIRAHAGDLQLEVIVVDSYSDDGTVEMVRSRHPWVRFLPQDIEGPPDTAIGIGGDSPYNPAGKTGSGQPA